MTPTRIALTLAALAATLTAAPLAPATPAATRLVATVGPGFNITLTKNGTRVRTLRPGTYTIVVRDRSDEHNFRLNGPSLNRATGVERIVSATWTVRLRRGTYRYVCDPHADGMRGSFVVR